MNNETAADDASLVLYDVEDRIALITWNRPHRMNAWTPALETEYFELLHEAARDPNVRAIVVTGAGGNFSAGMDKQLLAQSSDGDRASAPEHRQPQTLPMTIPKPIIAAIQGACAGTGFIQACVSDVRFAESDAKITTAFPRRGIHAEHGLSYLLPSLVGVAHSLDILLSGRGLSGEDASRIGLTQLSKPGCAIDDACSYAREIADTCSPQALAVTKLQVYANLRVPLESARKEALILWQSLRDHADFKEGVASFSERRPPQFAPLDEEAMEGVQALWEVTQSSL